MRQITYAEAVVEAQAMAMRKDPDVFVAGEDIALIGGSFGATAGLQAEFGAERVFNTPISETAIIGLGVGSAVAGLRPVVELMYVDFIGVCLDELMNQAAKMRYMFGGKAKVPMVMRTCCGGGVSGAAHHSQSLEAILSHVPGLKVVMPSNAYDAKGLLLSSIWDDNPVMFLEHKALYSIKGDCPEGDYTVPLGKAQIIREGSDITIVAWGMMVLRALSAAEELAKKGINAEVIDIRTFVPLDKETILNSVGKTHRMVVVHEAVRTGGFGAEIAALVAEEAMYELEAPIIRVTAPDTSIPSSPILEAEFLPSEEKIIAAVERII